MAAKIEEDDNPDFEEDDNSTTHTGRWTRDEHQAFLHGLRVYGREWKKVAQSIKTRTSAQIRSHAQKYFAKSTSKDRKDGSSGRQRGAGTSWLVRCVAATKEALIERRTALLNDQSHDEVRMEGTSDEKSLSTPERAHAGQKGPGTPELSSTNLSNEELLALSVLCSKAGPTTPENTTELPSPQGVHSSDTRKRERDSREQGGTPFPDRKRPKEDN